MPRQNVTLALPKKVLQRRALSSLKRPPNLGTRGRRTWTRDELHER